MNKKQKITLWFGIAVITVMALFPPTDRAMGYYHYSGRASDVWHSGYTFLLIASPSQIAFTKLFIQWFVIASITIGLFVTFKIPKK